ncbi:MAG: BamA/TamA family outer membrane protein [Akkermansiaceae bacterium]|tara:strand:+ start:213 stop:530 length:318 start_codon:yes stop_codon:yes gene_type:complete
MLPNPLTQHGPFFLAAASGTAYWNTSVEYIRSINEPIKGIIFFDVGEIYTDTSDWFSFQDPSFALGLGLRIDLPIGPVRLEYGHNMNRRKGEPSGTFHFSIGTSF